MSDNINKSREKRDSFISMYVTESVKKEFAAAASDKDLQDEIISKYVKSEIGFIEDEILQMDEMNVRYRAKLLSIRDTFSKVSEVEFEKINAIDEEVRKVADKIDETSNKLKGRVEEMCNDFLKVNKAIGYINVERFERMLDCVDRYNRMSKDEKEIVQTLIESKN